MCLYLHTKLFISSSLVLSAVLLYAVQSHAAQVGITLILQPSKTTNVDDAVGQWQYDSGDVIYPEGTVAGHYIRTRLFMSGTSAPQNIAMSTTVLFVDGPIPGSFTLQGAYYFDNSAQPNTLSGEKGSVSAFSDEFAILKNARYILTDTGILGDRQSLSLLINQIVDCTGYAYSVWGICTNGSQSRTVTGYTPYGCTGTPTASPVLTQGCTSSGDPAGTLPLTDTCTELTLPADGQQYFKFTLGSACTTSLKQLRVLMTNMSTAGGAGHALVKSSNQGRASWPTTTDFDTMFQKANYKPGTDWTTDPNGGVFFWTFNAITEAGESVTIFPTYANHPSFSQADTYYVLVRNTGTISNTYRVQYKCY